MLAALMAPSPPASARKRMTFFAREGNFWAVPGIVIRDKSIMRVRMAISSVAQIGGGIWKGIILMILNVVSSPGGM
jgi:hypothetical protein